MVEWLFLVVPRGCLRFVIVVFPDHTHLLFLAVVGPTVAQIEVFFISNYLRVVRFFLCFIIVC